MDKSRGVVPLKKVNLGREMFNGEFIFKEGLQRVSIEYAKMEVRSDCKSYSKGVP